MLESEPPPLELGSRPPDVVLESYVVPSASLRPPSVPKDAPIIEHVVIRNIAPAPRHATTPPPAPPPTVEMRAQKLVKQLETAGPGLEAHIVEAILRLGPDALPVVTAAFPGLLWFNRRHPHRAVARGRDVSPVARTLVAFGQAAVPSVQRLMHHRHPDVRFYATLVAQDLASPVLVHDLAEATLDGDAGIRDVAAAALIGLGPEAAGQACGSIRRALQAGMLARAHTSFAVAALARLRDPRSPPVLIPLLEPDDPEINDLTIRALAMITGQTLARDVKAWRKWWEKNRHRPRVEWLIDSLERGHFSIYEFVCDEVAGLVGQPLGEADVDDTKERKRIAKAYRALCKAK